MRKDKQARAEYMRVYRKGLHTVNPDSVNPETVNKWSNKDDGLTEGSNTGGCGFPNRGTMYYGKTSEQTVRCPDCNTVIVRRDDAQAMHNRYMQWRYACD